MSERTAWFAGFVLTVLALMAVAIVIVTGQNFREHQRQDTKQSAAESGCNYNNGEIICKQQTKTVTVE